MPENVATKMTIWKESQFEMGFETLIYQFQPTSIYGFKNRAQKRKQIKSYRVLLVLCGQSPFSAQAIIFIGHKKCSTIPSRRCLNSTYFEHKICC